MQDTCVTIYEDNTRCDRERYGRKEICKPCYKWSMRNGWASPDGRPRTVAGSPHPPCSTTGCVNPRLRAGTMCGACEVWAENHPGKTLSQRAAFGTKPDTCITDGCANPVCYQSYGWCNACYQWSNANDMADPNTRPCIEPNDGRCEVILEDGTRCTRETRHARMCSTHQQRNYKYGSPLVKTKRSPGELQALLRKAAKGLTSECIIVTGFKGRPRAKYDGRSMNAATAVWIIANGPDGMEGMDVCHLCNGGSGENGCININCLYLGTRKQNVADMVAAGRSANGDPKGERNGRHVLTDEDVREIRRLRAEGVTCVTLADVYGVSPRTISRAATGETWRHVA